jgi:hypothetical protein
MVMTEHELFLLTAGASTGSYLTLLAWMAMSFVSERRADRRRSRRAEQRAAKRAATDGWRGSVRPSGEPHPAELLEASVRGFELSLYDCLDRVEDAMRRDGLL